MRHLILSRELPPAAYPVGGIGTYVSNISRLLAVSGDTVHVIGQQWGGAPAKREALHGGRLILHRVPIDAPINAGVRRSTPGEIDLLRNSAVPAQAWSWNAALLAESLVEAEEIDAIEAQEWEAPLYFFLLRRALGLGPSSTPPCIIQLHSPSEFIWQHNEWSIARPDYLPMRRQEEYCIAAADALLCPSRYLARQAIAHYGLAPGSVHVIPCPVGDFPAAAHEARGYAIGPVTYVGRLEPRKGLIEFIEAAIAVASDRSGITFEFAGADVPYRDGATVLQYLRTRIPAALRGRFVFRGALGRRDLAALLARSRLAVVPSRWENFPNSCIEAMHAAVPVLVSPDGGMAEMMEDGRTGWIASSQRPADLEVALRRALDATPAERETMGRAAAVRIRERCNDDRVTEGHRRWRRSVAARGAAASLKLPSTLPWAGAAMHDESPSRREAKSAPSGNASFVSGDSWTAVQAALEGDATSDAVLFARSGYKLEPAFVELARAVLAQAPDVAIVAGWVEDDAAGDPATCPAFPYQWLRDGVSPMAVIRRLAFEPAIGRGLEAVPEPFAMWGVVNDLLAAGWKAVAAPMVAGSRTAVDRGSSSNGQALRERELRRTLRERHPDLVARDANALIWLVEGGALQAGAPSGASLDRWTGLSPSQIAGMSLGGKLTLAAGAVKDPRRTWQWLRNQWAGRRSPGSGAS